MTPPVAIRLSRSWRRTKSPTLPRPFYRYTTLLYIPKRARVAAAEAVVVQGLRGGAGPVDMAAQHRTAPPSEGCKGGREGRLPARHKATFASSRLQSLGGGCTAITTERPALSGGVLAQYRQTHDTVWCARERAHRSRRRPAFGWRYLPQCAAHSFGRKRFPVRGDSTARQRGVTQSRFRCHGHPATMTCPTQRKWRPFVPFYRNLHCQPTSSPSDRSSPGRSTGAARHHFPVPTSAWCRHPLLPGEGVCAGETPGSDVVPDPEVSTPSASYQDQHLGSSAPG